MRWVKRTSDGAYIVRRTFEGWTVETVNKRGRNLLGPIIVTPKAALAIIMGRTEVSAANAAKRRRCRLGRQRHRNPALMRGACCRCRGDRAGRRSDMGRT